MQSFAAFIVTSLLGGALYAQAPALPTPAASTRTVQPPPASPAVPSRPVPTESYTYVPDGRRDPFLSLLGSGGDSRGTRHGDGAAGMTVGEISVRGVMMSRGEMLAMIQGPDNKTYIVHSGDRLLDGTIKSINTQGLVVDQQVNDPLSIVKHREIPKLLRSLEGGKEKP